MLGGSHARGPRSFDTTRPGRRRRRRRCRLTTAGSDAGAHSGAPARGADDGRGDEATGDDGCSGIAARCGGTAVNDRGEAGRSEGKRKTDRRVQRAGAGLDSSGMGATAGILCESPSREMKRMVRCSLRP